MKEKLWTPRYLFSLLLVFGVNMGYALLNSVMAIYAERLDGSSVLGGWLISAFTLSALVSRLFIKKLNERFTSRQLLRAGLLLTVAAGVGYCLAGNIPLFLLFRVLHGVGFGISMTCATAISNLSVPASRLSEGVGFTSSANTVANAIGPSIALAILGDGYENFLTLFLTLLAISVLAALLSAAVPQGGKAAPAASARQSYKGIPVALVFFGAAFAQSAVNGYLTLFAREKSLGNIGLFFTITAAATFCSRFFSGRLQRRFGEKRMTRLLTGGMGLSLAALTLAENAAVLCLLAIPYGVSCGLLYPLFNYRIIQTVDRSQFAFASSVYYSALDAGYGLGSIAWGAAALYTGYSGLFPLAGALVLLLYLPDYLVRRKWNV